jgi:hypothetical protein
MREDDHDKSHDREAVHAACFLPVAVRLKEVNPQVVKTRPIAVQEGTKACVPDHRDRGSEVYRSDAVEIWARTTNQTLGSGSFSTSSEPFSPRPESPRYPVFPWVCGHRTLAGAPYSSSRDGTVTRGPPCTLQVGGITPTTTKNY